MEEQIKKTFATPEGCDLVLENVQGHIEVEGWDQPETEVVAMRHQEWAEVEMRQEGRQVVVRTRDERGPAGLFGADACIRWFFGGRTPAVDYTVHVPHASNLRLKSVNGPIHVAQVAGEVHAHNVDGSVALESVAGEVVSETVNGSVQAAQLQGKARLKAVNGKLQVQGGHLGGLTAEAVNGQIEVSAALAAEGRYDFHTVNGDCHLAVPANLRARVTVHGVNSHVKCNVPSQSVERQFGHWQGVIGEGDGPLAEITFHTVNGSLHIDGGAPAAWESAPFAARAKPAPEPAPESEPVVVKVAAPAGKEEAEQTSLPSQSDVLRMLERGEITVDEALALLKKLGG
jgi:hypothetical protein